MPPILNSTNGAPIPRLWGPGIKAHRLCIKLLPPSAQYPQGETPPTTFPEPSQRGTPLPPGFSTASAPPPVQPASRRPHRAPSTKNPCQFCRKLPPLRVHWIRARFTQSPPPIRFKLCYVAQFASANRSTFPRSSRRTHNLPPPTRIHA